MLDAAVAWKGYGTKVTGFDMVDITKSLRTAAARNGVSENISFVKGNLYVYSTHFLVLPCTEVCL